MKKRVRFRNKDDGLRVVYDEHGSKKELVPGGTIFMDLEWGSRYRCLERVEEVKKEKGSKKEEVVTE